jgi:hypothetical protein
MNYETDTDLYVDLKSKTLGKLSETWCRDWAEQAITMMRESGDAELRKISDSMRTDPIQAWHRLLQIVRMLEKGSGRLSLEDGDTVRRLLGFKRAPASILDKALDAKRQWAFCRRTYAAAHFLELALAAYKPPVRVLDDIGEPFWCADG